jgi:leucine-rich PPR motif-containing protein
MSWYYNEALMHLYKQNPEQGNIFYDLMVKDEKVTNDAFNMMLSIRLQNGEDVTSMLEYAPKLGDIDFQTATTIIDAYFSIGDVVNAEQIFQKLCETGAPPDAVTFSIVINHYGRLQQLDNAEKTFQKMLDFQVEPDPQIVNTLIDVYWKNNKQEKAISMYESLPEDLIDNRMRAAMVRVYFSIRECEKAMDVFAKIPTHGEEYTIAQSFVIKGLVRISGEQAEDFCDQIVKENRQLDRVLESDILLVYVRKKEGIPKAMNFFKNMKNPNVVHFGIMITACFNFDEFELGHQLYTEMIKYDFEINTRMLVMMVRGYTRAGMFKHAESLIVQVNKKTKLATPTQCYYLLLEGYARVGSLNSVVKKLQILDRKGVRMEKSYLHKILESLCCDPKAAEVFLVDTMIGKYKIVPDTTTLEVLQRGLAEVQKRDLLNKLVSKKYDLHASFLT